MAAIIRARSDVGTHALLPLLPLSPAGCESAVARSGLPRRLGGLLRACLAVAVMGGFAGFPAAAQERIALKVAHTFPAGHGVHTDFLLPWSQELEKRSGQRVKVTVLDGGAPQGNAANLLERLQAGELDIVHGLPGSDPGRFPRTHLIEVPFLAESATTGSRVLWALRDKQLRQEYAGLKVLALHTDNGGLVHTGPRKVAAPEDLKGLRLRSPSTAANKVLAAFGATPLGMPPAQSFANLRAGLIDGALFSWDAARQYRIVEAARHHLDARMFTTSYFLVMTQKRYQSLPAEVRKALDDISGAALVERFGPWWDKWDQPGLETARKRGAVITSLNAAQRQAWAAKAAPAIDRFLAELTKAGVADARAVYTEMRKMVRGAVTQGKP